MTVNFSTLLIIIIAIILVFPAGKLQAQEKFYNYYDKGLKFMEKGDWIRAAEEFKSAISLEFEDAKRKRTYGTRFIKYFPHRELGIAYYNLGEYDKAMGELQLSLAYKHSQRAKVFVDKLSYDGISAIDVEKPGVEEITEKPEIVEDDEEEIEEEPEDEIVKMPDKVDLSEEDDDEEYDIISTGKLPAGALTYDPTKVTQVGSRLTVAVLPFEANEKAANLTASVTEKLITQLVNLRRFRVIERGAIEQVMKEQAFNLSGMVDEDSAIEVGKIVGADVIVMGRINIEIGFGKVSARGVDIETGETIVAKEASAGNTNIEHIEKLVESVAVMIYNDLPLVEGSIVSEDEEDALFYLDIGSDVGVRKGTKCVAYREGKTIKHPKTKKVLGKKVTKLGELIVIQVQEKLATARVVAKEGSIEVGDKVVVK